MTTPKMKKRKPRRAARGALWLVSGLFLASVAVRLAGGTGEAIAKEMKAFTAQADPTAPGPVCAPPEDIGLVLEALNARGKALEAREAALADRKAALALAEREIERNLAALEQAEEELAATMTRADGAAEADLARLTEVYEAMKPKEAAALFETMAPEFAAGFLGRMRPDIAASVMAGLSSDSAYTISVLMAGRNARVPKE